MAEPRTGTCGSSAEYSLDWDGTLTVYGSGAIFDYNDRTKKSPWYDFRDDILKIVINSGITAIGMYNFRRCHNLLEVSIPNSVTEIGMFSFDWCENLEKLTLGTGVKHIRRNAFDFCDLDSVILPNGLLTIGAEAFRFNADIPYVKIPTSVTSIGVAAFGGMQHEFELIGDSKAVEDYCLHNSCYYAKESEKGKERH
jgi:hypothetical protein